MTEYDIQQIASELKTTYQADDLTVLSFPTFREYHPGLARLLKPEYRANTERTFTGMVFLSSQGTVDAKPYIAVCEEASPSQNYTETS